MNAFKFKLAFLIAIIFSVFIPDANAQPYGPYNQSFTMNQQYGSTNWYSSPLGMGAAQAGVMLMGGIVNMMSRPDPVVVQQQAPVYVNGGGGGYGGGYPIYNNGYGGNSETYVAPQQRYVNPYYGYGPR